MKSNFQHVNYLWDDATADKLDPVDRLVYRSNILGADQRITNTGGGNTSSKVRMADPLTGEEVEVMWVKGSGGDLRTSKRANFASLYMDKLRSLQAIYDRAAEKGVKTAIEDEMVALYTHCVYNLNPRATSIDTPLHSFIPAAHVDHTHPNAVIAIAAARNSEALTAEIFGDEIGWVGWQRPGYDLGLVMGDLARQNPTYRGLVMGGHGLINWADDDKQCYELSLEIIEKAAQYIASRDKGVQTFGGQKYAALADAERDSLLVALLPRLRGLVSQQNRPSTGSGHRFIATVQSDPTILEFVNSHDAARLAELGTSCPD
ncbi:MAG TPA: class II aldolase/adducin family protein, partial [Caldilineaceae bacterium]|nr:class II aldolase/adducin family protein [Caldilineaceae bacterium]